MSQSIKPPQSLANQAPLGLKPAIFTDIPLLSRLTGRGTKDFLFSPLLCLGKGCLSFLTYVAPVQAKKKKVSWSKKSEGPAIKENIISVGDHLEPWFTLTMFPPLSINFTSVQQKITLLARLTYVDVAKASK